MTPGLNEEDPEAHTRPDKRSRSSHQPELPIADGDQTDDDEGPPGLGEESEDDDDATIDYRDDSDYENDFDTADSNLMCLTPIGME